MGEGLRVGAKGGVHLCTKASFFPSENSKGMESVTGLFLFLFFNEQTEEQPSGLAKLREADI